MFGGLAFMVRGHMFVGVLQKPLMARVGPEGYEKVLKQPHVRMMDFTGKPLRGYVYVGPRAIEFERALRSWVERCLEYARSLKAK
jgi:TfoX/Sxy family transcriptional regulator of competence genes